MRREVRRRARAGGPVILRAQVGEVGAQYTTVELPWHDELGARVGGRRRPAAGRPLALLLANRRGR